MWDSIQLDFLSPSTYGNVTKTMARTVLSLSLNGLPPFDSCLFFNQGRKGVGLF